MILLTSATAFSTLAVFMKTAYAEGVNLTTLLAFRFLFSALLCGGAIIVSGNSLVLPRAQRGRILLLGGVVHVLVSVFYAASVQRLPAALTGLIFYLYPAMVAGMAILTGWERANRTRLTALAVCFAGLVLVMGASVGAVSASGLLLGMAAAFGQACHVLLSHAILFDLPPLLTAGWSALATAGAFFLYGVLSGDLMWNMTWVAWGAVFGTALFANFIGISLFFLGMRLVGPSNASIVMNLEPVLTVVLAVLFLGETLEWEQALGGGILLGGLCILHVGGDTK